MLSLLRAWVQSLVGESTSIEAQLKKRKKKKISTSISQSLLLALQLTAALSFWLLSTEFKFLRYTERMSSSSRLQKQVSPRRETRNCTGHRNQQPSTGKHSTG